MQNGPSGTAKVLVCGFKEDSDQHCMRMGDIHEGEVRLLGWSKHVGYAVLNYQPESVGKHTNIFRLVIERCSVTVLY